MNLRGDQMWLRSMYVSPVPLVAEYNFSRMIVGGFEVEVLPLVPEYRQQYPIGGTSRRRY
jgi:hypothetical protein